MRFSLILKAVTASWAAVIANAAVGIFLTPYILHHLGDDAFGVWVLTTNLVGYYGFFDMGVRASILRYVSRYKALGDLERVNEVMASAFYYYLLGCVLIILVGFFSVGWVSHFFAIHENILAPFKSLFLLAAVVQGLSLPLIVFASSLEAAGRYDQIYSVTVACLAGRVVAVIWVLQDGGGLFAVGAVTLLSQFLVYCIQVPLTVRSYPGLSLRPKWVRKSVFHDMLRYGSITLTVGVAERMRSYMYPVLIAKFLTAAAVTVFSLPMKIISFVVEGITTMIQFVNPLSSQLDAHNDFASLRDLIILSVQSAYLVFAPLAVFFIVFGRDLLSVWVGSAYASAYPLLVLITLGMGTAAAQFCVQSMLFGIERHKQLIWYRMAEGLSITILGSIALYLWGLEGFAWVIAITLLVTNLIFIPRHLCRILDLSLRRYLMQGCIKPCILALPAAVAFLALQFFLDVDSWPTMIFVLLVGGLTYGVTLLLVTLKRSRPTFGWASIAVLQLLEQRFLRPLLSR